MASVQVKGEAIHSGQGAENREGAGRGGVQRCISSRWAPPAKVAVCPEAVLLVLLTGDQVFNTRALHVQHT